MSDDERDEERETTSPTDVREWAVSIRETVVGPVALLNRWFGRRGPFVRSLLGGALATAIGLGARGIGLDGLDPFALVPPDTTDRLLLSMTGTLAGIVIALVRGFIRLETAVTDRMTDPVTDGGTTRVNRRPERSGAGAVSGLFIGVGLGAAYGLAGVVAGAIFGAVVGDAIEELSIR